MGKGNGRGDGDHGPLEPILVLRKIRNILECFTVETPELTLPEIRERTTLPASTCQRLVQNLAREGFLDRHGDRYRIGLHLVRMAAPGAHGLDLVRQVQPVLDRLRDETGETACLFVRDGAYRTVVGLAETRHLVKRMFAVGMVTALHAGSAGKVFLAHDETAWHDAVNHGLAPVTGRTIVDPGALTVELDEIRGNGYAASFEEREAGAASISAPVFGVHGQLVAVLGIAAPVQRLTQEAVPAMARAVIAAAADASTHIGCAPGLRTGLRT